MQTLSKSSRCPCGSALKYIKCCGQYLRQGKHALTAEALMRSRYTAYVLRDEEYLLKSWHQSTRPLKLELENETTEWLKLELLATHQGRQGDTQGTVEFIAYFKAHMQRQQLHEVSHFVREDNQWYYLDAEHNEI